MNRPLTDARAKRYAQLLFWLGCLAVFMHLWAGTRLMVMHPAKLANQGVFFGEICTVLGSGQGSSPAANNASAGRQTPSFETAQLPTNHDSPGKEHNCCTLCGASSPLLLTLASTAVPPAPTFQLGRTTAPAAPAARSFAWIAPPSRAPPLV